ncbi:hypothetical protein CVT24_011580 [Panaeolus cyanescens]|uniref:Uncharacterized protein n=1 Tax=Panaeolus cyanescens TaxID=181874 RepID=A0A409YV66_9AGAR|nr:hypothetical protein CVT24_011580 [Panaeolus cyanescens]
MHLNEDTYQWEKVLWKRHAYPDNYVPPKQFLASLQRNHEREATVNHLKAFKSSIMMFLTLMSLSPVLRTLTAATSSDSVWALAAVLFLLSALLADYRATKPQSGLHEGGFSIRGVGFSVINRCLSLRSYAILDPLIRTVSSPTLQITVDISNCVALDHRRSMDLGCLARSQPLPHRHVAVCLHLIFCNLDSAGHPDMGTTVQEVGLSSPMPKAKEPF